LRDQMPQVEEIVQDPHGARLAQDATYQVAAIGLMSRVADRDLGAAWVYTNRLRTEFRMAIARQLIFEHGRPASDRFRKEGNAIMMKTMADMHLMRKARGML